MMEQILIKNTASFGSEPESLDGLGKVNFVFGSNGTGKTTISRIIDGAGSNFYNEIKWRNNIPLETLVYNRDFIEDNFNQADDLKGIFTLGKKDKETVEALKSESLKLSNINKDIEQLTRDLEGETGTGGKKNQLKQAGLEFADKCWNVKLRYEDRFEQAFKGYRGSKADFRRKVLFESTNNTSDPIPLSELVSKSESVFKSNPQKHNTLVMPSHANIIELEKSQILTKRIIGKQDVDIAALINEIGSSDWVRQGLNFYDPIKQICPFCQQKTNDSLQTSLDAYFDNTFQVGTAEIDTVLTGYITERTRILQDMSHLSRDDSGFLDIKNLQPKVALLELESQTNIERIEEKQKEPSKVVRLKSLQNILESIKKLIDASNSRIQTHNEMVNNIEHEKVKLIKQIWRYLLDSELITDLKSYNTKTREIQGEIVLLEEKILELKSRKKKVEDSIRELEKQSTSMQPTIDSINNYLQSFGFIGFRLTKSVRERYYSIQRQDGSDAKETLSEGERSFVTFLYFYHLINGSVSETGLVSDRVVVVDDPVSSLDSDVQFVVGNMIKQLFENVRSNSGPVKQVVVLTHNIYLLKSIFYKRGRNRGNILSDETFWVVRKHDLVSKVEKKQSMPIKTMYELLWEEIRNPDYGSPSIPNTLRRILEYYFQILGNVNYDKIADKFDGQERQICYSLFSWVNEGSHSVHDDLYFSLDRSLVDRYLNVFRRVFEVTENDAHYEMMMGNES